jgi:hypothetical protein
MSNLVCANRARLKTISPTKGKKSDRGKKNLKHCSAFHDFEKTGNQRKIIQKINWKSTGDLPENKMEIKR